MPDGPSEQPASFTNESFHLDGHFRDAIGEARFGFRADGFHHRRPEVNAHVRRLDATLDLQVIESALKKKLGSSGLESIDTTVVAGLRLYMRF
jgi:hypothetical protein